MSLTGTTRRERFRCPRCLRVVEETEKVDEKTGYEWLCLRCARETEQRLPRERK